MPNVMHYEKEFDATVAHYTTNMREIDERLALQGMPPITPANKIFIAAATLEAKYRKKFQSHEADILMMTLAVTSNNKFWHDTKINVKTSYAGSIKLAVISMLGFDINNLGDTENKAVEDAIAKQLVDPTPEFKKYFLASFFDRYRHILELALKPKSDFASICYVIANKLQLPISPETRRKLILAANFSQKMLFCCGSSQRQTEELANLDSQTAKASPDRSVRLA